MHSFFVETLGSAGEPAILAARERDHLFKTLRANPGDEVELLDGRGGRASGIVRPGKSVELICIERVPEPERKLLLCCAAPRKAKFDVLLKQAAELGVSAIRLIECERSVASPEGSDRWTTLLQEGCKQSKNPFLPQVSPPVPLAEALRELRVSGVSGWFGAVRSDERVGSARGDVAWFVGPEGGFTEAEELRMRDAGVSGLNLGPYVLRLETAALCGLAVLRQYMR